MRIRPSAAGALAALTLLFFASSAHAVSIQIESGPVGPLTSGVGVLPVSGSFDVIVSLDSTESLTGYDLTVSWDPAEVQLDAAENLFFPAGSFFTSPVGGDPAAARVAAVTVGAPSPTDDLFRLTFSTISPVADGLGDVSVFFDAVMNGAPFSPPMTLDNPAGASLDVVPEPSTALLVAFGLAAGGRRRRSTDKHAH